MGVEAPAVPHAVAEAGVEQFDPEPLHEEEDVVVDRGDAGGHRDVEGDRSAVLLRHLGGDGIPAQAVVRLVEPEFEPVRVAVECPRGPESRDPPADDRDASRHPPPLPSRPRVSAILQPSVRAVVPASRRSSAPEGGPARWAGQRGGRRRTAVCGADLRGPARSPRGGTPPTRRRERCRRPGGRSRGAASPGPARDLRPGPWRSAAARTTVSGAWMAAGEGGVRADAAEPSTVMPGAAPWR